MGKGRPVKCSQGYCKLKGSYPSLVRAKEAIGDHKAETQMRSLGAHQAVIVQETPARYAVAYRRSSAPTEEVTMIHRLHVWARLDSRTSGAHRPPADAMPSVPKQEIRVYAQREELAGLLRREQAVTPERSP